MSAALRQRDGDIDVENAFFGQHRHVAAVFFSDEADGAQPEAVPARILFAGAGQAVFIHKLPVVIVFAVDDERAAVCRHFEADDLLFGLFQLLHRLDGVVEQIAEQRV